MTGEPFFRMSGVEKVYPMADEELKVLCGIDLSIERGEFLAVLGPSGSGKSTLMNIIGCLDVPTAGEYLLDGRRIDQLDEVELSHLRNREIGFVFQAFHLLPRLNALQNVELPLIYARLPLSERKKRAEAMLDRVGLSDRMHHFPNQLSGGQQQRVAIARALVTDPAILLADEPTGALDQLTGRQVMALFREINAEGRTIVMITHDTQVASYAGRVVKMLDGRIEGSDADVR